MNTPPGGNGNSFVMSPTDVAAIADHGSGIGCSSSDSDSDRITRADSEKLRSFLEEKACDNAGSTAASMADEALDSSEVYIAETSKKCPNVACSNRATHFHGHRRHHIEQGCRECGMVYCYKCLSSEKDNVKERGGRANCKCGYWTSFCSSFKETSDIDRYLVLEPYPYDKRYEKLSNL